MIDLTAEQVAQYHAERCPDAATIEWARDVTGQQLRDVAFQFDDRVSLVFMKRLGPLLCVDGVVFIENPTIGQVWTTRRLFQGVTG